MYWFDKWHVSPYYSSSHAIIACLDYDTALAQSTVEWILNTQRPDGSWGYYFPTAEETAYALQALSIWAKSKGKIPHEAIRRGAAWLRDHMQPPYPALWIAKILFYSEWVIRAEILSALMLASQIEG